MAAQWNIEQNGQCAGGGPNTTPASLRVDGWHLAEKVPIEGTYHQDNWHHERPVFTKYDKQGNPESFIYYWDERDGKNFQGWWFAPSVGGHSAWARHLSCQALSPPRDGWLIPALNNEIVSEYFRVMPATMHTTEPSFANTWSGATWHHNPSAGEQHNDYSSTPNLAQHDFRDAQYGKAYGEETWAGGCPDVCACGKDLAACGACGKGWAQVADVSTTMGTSHHHGASGGAAGGAASPAPRGVARAPNRAQNHRDRSRSAPGANAPRQGRERGNNGVARVFGALRPYANEEDHAYARTKAEEPPPFPMCLNDKGKLVEVTYGGHGWPLFFSVPGEALRKIHSDDFRRVMGNIEREMGLQMEPMTTTDDGTLQFRLGTAKGSGTVQLYLTQLSRVSGNVRIQIGSKNTERLKAIRRTLLKSAWFEETMERTCRISEKNAEHSLKEYHYFALPCINLSTNEQEVKRIVKVTHKLIGQVARRALEEYLQRHGFTSEHPIQDFIQKTYEE
jgi:hypothetical protein